MCALFEVIPAVSLAQAVTPPDQGGSDGLADRAFSLVQALPVEAHFTMILVLLGGLALWLFGGRLVKPLFALVGIALGGVVGLIVLPALGLEEVGGAPGSLVGMGVGALIGMVISLVLLKVAIIFVAGLGFAAAGFLGATLYLEYNPLPDEAPPAFVVEDDTPRDPSGQLLFKNPLTGENMTVEQLTRSLREADSILGGGPGGDGGGDETATENQDQSERFAAIAARCRAVVMQAADTVKSHWNALSSRERLVVLGSTFGSMALGMLIGFFMPKKSTAVITALGGSAIWLVAGVWLVDAFLPSLGSVTTQPPEIWAVVWGIVFLLGMTVQFAGPGRPGESDKKPKKKDDDEEEDDEDE